MPIQATDNMLGGCQQTAVIKASITLTNLENTKSTWGET